MPPRSRGSAVRYRPGASRRRPRHSRGPGLGALGTRKRSASLLPSWRARSRSQTGIRVRATQASPPHTPGVLSMPGDVSANSRTTRWNSSALSLCDSDATCFSTSSNVLISSAFLSSGTANQPLIRNGTRHRRHGHRDGPTIGESKQPFNATRCSVPVAAAKFTDLIIPAYPRLGNQGTSEAEPMQASRPSVSPPRGRGAVATEAVAGFGADGGGRRSAEVAGTRLPRQLRAAALSSGVLGAQDHPPEEVGRYSSRTRDFTRAPPRSR